MPGSVIAVHVDAPDVAAAKMDALLAACNQVAEAGTCVPRAAVRNSELSVDVSVVWEDAYRSARIRVTPRNGTERHRMVDFKEDDDLTERWRTVGLAVGVIAESLQTESVPAGEQASPDESAARRTESPAAEGQAPAKAPAPWQRSRWWVDVMAAAAPAFDTGPWRLGALVRGAYRPASAPLLVETSVLAARRPSSADDVTVDFVTVGAGGAFALSPFRQAEVRLHAGAALEIISARLAPVDGSTATGTVTDFGLQAGIDGAYAIAGWCSVVAGADLMGSTKDTIVRARGAPVGRVAPLTSAAIIGLRFTAPGE